MLPAILCALSKLSILKRMHQVQCKVLFGNKTVDIRLYSDRSIHLECKNTCSRKSFAVIVTLPVSAAV